MGDSTASEAISDLQNQLDTLNLSEARPRNLYATDLFFTLNTNQAFTSEEDEAFHIELLRQFLEEDLFTDNVIDLIRTEAGLGEGVQSVDISDIGIEIGSMRHRLHAHAQISIITSSRLKLSGMQKRWQEYVNEGLPWTRGVNVALDLLESGRMKNYILKEQNIDRIRLG
jgi:hypothetical protein